MEETIGYEALFSSGEWDSIELADEAFLDNLSDAISSGAAVSGSGRAALSEAVPEGSFSHAGTIASPPGQYEGNEDRYELECARCDYIGAADTLEEAQAMVRLHEEFVAVLTEKWEVK